jgi:hypothetical protein
MRSQFAIIPASQSDDSFGCCASSPLAGEDSAARFLFFTKIDLAALGGGCSLEPAPHPRPFPRNGGKGEGRKSAKGHPNGSLA